jgi:hypothetical protein
MSNFLKLAFPLFVATLLPAQFDPRFLRVIGPETKMIEGVDLNSCRARNFTASPFCAVPLPYAGTAAQLISIEEKAQNGTNSLTILGGFVKATGPDEPNRPAPIFLESSVAIAGDPKSVQSAAERWKVDAPASDLARDVRQLADSYDGWFLIDKPFQDLHPPAPEGKQRFRAEVEQVIERISGGIRFGPSDAVRVEIHTRSAEDAFSLAAIGRWIPGLIQLMQPDDDFSRILDIAEDFDAHAQGKSVVLSFNVPEEKLRDVVKTFNHVLQ